MLRHLSLPVFRFFSNESGILRAKCRHTTSILATEVMWFPFAFLSMRGLCYVTSWRMHHPLQISPSFVALVSLFTRIGGYTTVGRSKVKVEGGWCACGTHRGLVCVFFALLFRERGRRDDGASRATGRYRQMLSRARTSSTKACVTRASPPQNAASPLTVCAA